MQSEWIDTKIQRNDGVHLRGDAEQKQIWCNEIVQIYDERMMHN